MVSAAKLRRSQDNIVNARPYARKLLDVIQRMAMNVQITHPFLKRPNSSNQKLKLLLVVLTSDRGLCGGFNNAICKYTEGFIKQQKDNYKQIDLFLLVVRVLVILSEEVSRLKKIF